MPTTPRVTPRTKRPSHDITLSDGIRTYGLRVDPQDLKEVPQTPSTLHLTAGGGSASKFGDFDPTMAQLVQSDWSGGRGQENFSDDPSRFFDSQNCWTLTPNKLLPGPRWMYTRGIVGQVMIFPDEIEEAHFSTTASVNWQPLLGSTRYISSKFSGFNDTLETALIWRRRIGSPGTFTIAIYSDNAGSPNAALSSYTSTTTGANDIVSEWAQFDISQAIVSGTDYHMVVFGASTDNAQNHWEIGFGTYSSNTANQSANGSSWSAASGRPFFRLENAVSNNTQWHFFTLDGQTYVVSQAPDGTTAASLYINGARGKATAGGATTLTDTNASFPTFGVAPLVGQYVNGYIKIINGTGAGQVRKITANTSTVITVSGWSKNPDNTSEYIIYGVGYWTEVTGTGLTKPVTSVCVTGSLPGIAYFAQGPSTNMRRMRFNASAATPAHEFADDGSNKADLLYTTQYGATTDKLLSVWVVQNSQDTNLRRCDSQGWGTNLSSSNNTFKIGSKQFKITGLADYNKGLVITKEDSVWTIGVAGEGLTKIPVGIESSPHPQNGVAVKALGLFLYFNYMHSLEQFYGTTLNDVGPWRGSGIPSGRTGTISCITSAFNWIFVAVNGGDNNYSSVFIFDPDGGGYHEIFRGWAPGQPIHNLYWVPIETGQPVLFIEIGGQFVYMRFPQDALNPLNDSTFKYQHEAVLTMSTIDFGNARLPKLFKEIAAIQKNLASGIYMAVDYQLDRNIGGTSWTQLGSFLQSPEDTLPMGFGNARLVRLRLRLITNNALTPVECKATILEGYSRTPVKYQYNLRLREKKTNVNRRGGRDPDPDVIYAWLREKANGASRILMRSRYKSMDNRYVIVEPPVINRTSADSNKSGWGGDLLITLRDE